MEVASQHDMPAQEVTPSIQPLPAEKRVCQTASDAGFTGSVATQDKLYLLGFMPIGEVSGLVRGELGEANDLDRIKKLWLPKTERANILRNSQPQLLDNAKMSDVVKEIPPEWGEKLKAAEMVLQKNPFWKANKHTFKLIRLDEIIVLQNSVNLNRAKALCARIKNDATIGDLIDLTVPRDRGPSPIFNHWISSNAVLFSSPDHDVRPGQIEVRQVPQFTNGEGASGRDVPALVIPIVQGDPYAYCVRTYTQTQLPDGSMQRVYWITIQNGIHRAYALRSLGFEYMPCILVDPTSSDESRLLMGNWSPERMQMCESQRPPLLKDFFDPQLTEKFQVRNTTLCVRVGFNIEKFTT